MKKALKIISLAILIILLNSAILINAVQAVEKSIINIDISQKEPVEI